MNLREKLENLEERIGRKWMRRIKIIALTIGVSMALGCSREYKSEYYGLYGQAQTQLLQERQHEYKDIYTEKLNNQGG